MTQTTLIFISPSLADQVAPQPSQTAQRPPAGRGETSGEASLTEKRLLELIFGLHGESVHTYAQLSARYRVSVETIRRVVQRALRRPWPWPEAA